ncbi:hypothetical protein [Streptomyces sp. H27-S2]|uniref:hypothetical protein n=1 Tax=Streptomyces antarcticus TaxID=2996458 RepID=UPI0022716F1F|nr:hypothetical protein [Streptomyces sp. H27-S2]MCY0948297.1 hypothetical protein [Streptomyces sp. H27-S2]
MAKPSTVNLTKAAPTVSLDKHGVTSGLIKVNLNWTSPQAAAQRAAARGPWSVRPGPGVAIASLTS